MKRGSGRAGAAGPPPAAPARPTGECRNLVLTVGTSLLTGPGRPFSWRPGSPLPTMTDVLQWLRAADPVIASAELHTLHRLLETEGEGAGDRVTILSSQTEEGWLAARILARHLEDTGRARGIRTVETREVDGLTYEAIEFMQKGLRALARQLVQVVRRDRRESNPPRRTLFLATGGFKPESAYATLVGALTGVDVYYLHERFSRLVRIPPLPIRWDTTAIEPHRGLIGWLEEEPRPEREVRERLRGARELASLVDYPGDGHGYLSPVGLMLLDCLDDLPRAPDLAPPVLRDPRPAAEKSCLSQVPHHRPAGIDGFLGRLCDEDWVSLVRASPGTSASRAVRLRDPETGSFLVAYTRGDQRLDLDVQTTARAGPELRWVEGELARMVTGVSR